MVEKHDNRAKLSIYGIPMWHITRLSDKFLYDIFDDVEDIVCYTNELILTTCAEFVPNKIVTVRPKDKPWMSNEVRRAIRKRDRCFKIF